MTDKADNRAEMLAARKTAMGEEEKKLNEGRSGIGLRAFVAMTRGKNPQKVSYEGFDDEQNDSLPTTVNGFVEIVKPSDEKQMLSWLIDGFNQYQYSQASDPIAEFIDSAWDADTRNRFRLAVRNYSTATETSIEDSVSLIKPGFIKAAEKAAAAKAAVVPA